MNLGILASHNGTNAQAVIDACADCVVPAKTVALISNNSKSGAAQRAVRAGIPFCHLSGRTHKTPEELDLAICTELERHEVDLVVLAGYMKKLGPLTLQRFENRVLNTHPALLPDFGGVGMYGSHVHEAVIAAGVSETGITIHLVDSEYDSGPIIAQLRVPVVQADTSVALAERLLSHEHHFLVETIKQIVEGQIQLPTTRDTPDCAP